MRDPADCALPAWRLLSQFLATKRPLSQVSPRVSCRMITPLPCMLPVHVCGICSRRPRRSGQVRNTQAARKQSPRLVWCAPEPGTDRRAWPALRWQTREEPPFCAPDQAGGHDCPCRTELDLLLTPWRRLRRVDRSRLPGESWSVRRAAGCCAGCQPGRAPLGWRQLPGSSFSRRAWSPGSGC